MATNAQSYPLRDAFKAEPMSSNQPNSSTAGSAKESAKEPAAPADAEVAVKGQKRKRAFKVSRGP